MGLLSHDAELGSVHDGVVHEIIQRLEMGNIQGAHGHDRQPQHLVGTRHSLRALHIISLAGHSDVSFEMSLDMAVEAGLVSEEPITNAAGDRTGASRYTLESTNAGEVTITCVLTGNTCDVKSFDAT